MKFALEKTTHFYFQNFPKFICLKREGEKKKLLGLPITNIGIK
jgi:hypothetical protein